MMRFRSPLHIALIAALGLVIYSNTFSVPFHFDDRLNIAANEAVKDVAILLQEPYRPRTVGYLSFALNYRLHGLDVTGYHAVNIAVHILNALLVYFLAGLTLRTPRLGGGRGHLGGASEAVTGLVPLFSALLFVSHPIQTQAVTYIVQRLASLAAFFYLSSMVLYAKWRLATVDTVNGGRGPRPLWGLGRSPKVLLYVVSLLSTVLAMKTKETAFTLPLALALYESMFFEGARPPAGKGALKKRLIYLLPFFLTMPLVPLGFLGMDRPIGELIGDVGQITRLQSPIARLDYLFTEIRVMATYLRLLFLPIKQNLDYDYPIQDPLSAGVFFSLLLLAALFALGAYLLYRSRRNPVLRLPAFGLYFYILALLPESSLIPIADVIYEHRLYLPSAGFFIAASGAALIPAKSRKIAAALMSVAVIALSASAYARNTVWQSEIRLWEDVVEKSPGKARAHYNLAASYSASGRTTEAIGHYTEAIGLDPFDERYHYNLALAYHQKGMALAAIKHYEAALKLQPDYDEAANNLGIAYHEAGMGEKAIGHYKDRLSRNPDDSGLHYNLALIYQRTGNADMALLEYAAAIKLKPGFREAHNNIASVYLAEGDLDKAIAHYQSLLLLDPENPEVHLKLSGAFRQKGLISAAETHLMRAKQLGALQAK